MTTLEEINQLKQPSVATAAAALAAGSQKEIYGLQGLRCIRAARGQIKSKKQGMKARILNDWGVIRCIRLVVGTGAAVQGVLQSEWFLTIAGLFVVPGAVLTYGCCGSAGCSVSYSKKTNRNDGYV